MNSSTYQPPGQVSALEGLGNVQVAVIGCWPPLTVTTTAPFMVTT
jgi:hypothetical protein